MQRRGWTGLLAVVLLVSLVIVGSTLRTRTAIPHGGGEAPELTPEASAMRVSVPKVPKTVDRAPPPQSLAREPVPPSPSPDLTVTGTVLTHDDDRPIAGAKVLLSLYLAHDGHGRSDRELQGSVAWTEADGSFTFHWPRRAGEEWRGGVLVWSPDYQLVNLPLLFEPDADGDLGTIRMRTRSAPPRGRAPNGLTLRDLLRLVQQH